MKLADFGNVGLVAGGRSTTVGTPYWMAPEVIAGDGRYDAKADVWSFGILLLELADGEPPLYFLGKDQVLFQILTRPAPELDPNGSFSAEFRAFTSRCLVKAPAQRAATSELLTDPFLSKQCTAAEFDAFLKKVTR